MAPGLNSTMVVPVTECLDCVQLLILDYLHSIAGHLMAASTCDGLYSGIAVQLQQGDFTDAADVLQVFSLCILPRWLQVWLVALIGSELTN